MARRTPRSRSRPAGAAPLPVGRWTPPFHVVDPTRLAGRGINGTGHDAGSDGGGRIDTGANVVLGGSDQIALEEVAPFSHHGADRCAEIVGGQDLGDTDGIPFIGILDA